MKDELLLYKINVNVNDIDNFKIIGIENEMKHLILNLINNAKDAFEENKIKQREITINIYKENECNYLDVIDNAGGIPKNIIADIFKAHITSKQEGKGTGIGLYMASQIAKKHALTLDVCNVDNGAKFTLKMINKKI
jgi:C4-dicarboxylate-specific signal transduction histidine kinase